MFDDPKKQLERLQEQLLAAELPENAEPDRDEFAATEKIDLSEMLADDDFDGTQRMPLHQSFTPEEVVIPREPEAILPEINEEPAEQPEEEELPPKRSITWLVAALVAETLALVAVVAWWVMSR